eukprot:scaffold363569_cov34-Prasinocladus_malaysianus.AAC.1
MGPAGRRDCGLHADLMPRSTMHSHKVEALRLPIKRDCLSPLLARHSPRVRSITSLLRFSLT